MENYAGSFAACTQEQEVASQVAPIAPAPGPFPSPRFASPVPQLESFPQQRSKHVATTRSVEHPWDRPAYIGGFLCSPRESPRTSIHRVHPAQHSAPSSPRPWENALRRMDAIANVGESGHRRERRGDTMRYTAQRLFESASLQPSSPHGEAPLRYSRRPLATVWKNLADAKQRELLTRSVDDENKSEGAAKGDMDMRSNAVKMALRDALIEELAKGSKGNSEWARVLATEHVNASLPVPPKAVPGDGTSAHENCRVKRTAGAVMEMLRATPWAIAKETADDENDNLVEVLENVAVDWCELVSTSGFYSALGTVRRQVAERDSTPRVTRPNTASGGTWDPRHLSSEYPHDKNQTGGRAAVWELAATLDSMVHEMGLSFDFSTIDNSAQVDCELVDMMQLESLLQVGLIEMVQQVSVECKERGILLSMLVGWMRKVTGRVLQWLAKYREAGVKIGSMLEDLDREKRNLSMREKRQAENIKDLEQEINGLRKSLLVQNDDLEQWKKDCLEMTAKYEQEKASHEDLVIANATATRLESEARHAMRTAERKLESHIKSAERDMAKQLEIEAGLMDEVHILQENSADAKVYFQFATEMCNAAAAASTNAENLLMCQVLSYCDAVASEDEALVKRMQGLRNDTKPKKPDMVPINIRLSMPHATSGGEPEVIVNVGGQPSWPSSTFRFHVLVLDHCSLEVLTASQPPLVTHSAAFLFYCLQSMIALSLLLNCL
ncbi:hypothetical protein CYMTET_28111 [Cymbomonas tetramitiformis]|uniref:Uncharacterized protein n=1 Tax=Cymbomonas tetramitiformis TaxID=36881 RepID=A0AAE0KW97_9CHLO|nr:hypothetical protein CYMTET_28111 [Cymbomonas tetramitiformis]